jgi:transketolase C-terminal domain/subunit
MNIKKILKNNAKFIILAVALLAGIFYQKHTLNEINYKTLETTVWCIEYGFLQSENGKSHEEVEKVFLDHMRKKFPKLVKRLEREHSEENE